MEEILIILLLFVFIFVGIKNDYEDKKVKNINADLVIEWRLGKMVLVQKYEEKKMNIEEFEAKVHKMLDRPFVIEYLSLYKHKRILIREDPFYDKGKGIAWCIDSSYEDAFIKMLNLLSGERK